MYPRDAEDDWMNEMENRQYERCASEEEADREYANNVGHENANYAWILSPRDVWYKNPWYYGPPEPHPENGYDEACDLVEGNQSADALYDDIPW
jgi:hypothetical protein